MTTVSLDGRIALVTGTATGLGRTIAREFGAAGACGVGIDIAGQQPELPDDWIAVRGDVADERDLAAAIRQVGERFGRLDIVVANAGLVPPWHDTEDIDLDEWDRVFAVNVRGVAATIKLAVPMMKERGGTIVVMASLTSRQAHPGQCLYVATKHAVLGIVRATALDLGRYGIRVNAIGPGPVATEAFLERVRRRAEAGGPAEEDALRQFDAETALGRIATEADVARTALFLASDMSDGITGQIIPVDAGVS